MAKSEERRRLHSILTTTKSDLVSLKDRLTNLVSEYDDTLTPDECNYFGQVIAHLGQSMALLREVAPGPEDQPVFCQHCGVEIVDRSDPGIPPFEPFWSHVDRNWMPPRYTRACKTSTYATPKVI